YPPAFRFAFKDIYDDHNKMKIDDVVNEKLDYLFNNKAIVTYCMLFTVVFALVGSLSWINYDKLPDCYKNTNTFFMNNQSWYHGPNLLQKVLVVDVLGILVMFLLVTLGTLMLRNVKVIYNMTKYEYNA